MYFLCLLMVTHVLTSYIRVIDYVCVCVFVIGICHHTLCVLGVLSSDPVCHTETLWCTCV